MQILSMKLMVLLCVVGAGCTRQSGDKPEDSAPLPSKPAVFDLPDAVAATPDLTSGLTEDLGALTLYVASVFSPELNESVTALETGAELKFLPTDSTIPVSVTSVSDAESLRNNVGSYDLPRVNVEFGRLSKGWHELSLPAGRVNLSPREHVTSSGHWKLRFRVGSGPVVASVDFCPPSASHEDSPTTSSRLRIQFSEAVRLQDGYAIADAIQLFDEEEQLQVPCEEEPIPPEVDTRRVTHREPSRRWTLVCDYFPETARIAIPGGAVMSEEDIAVSSYGTGQPFEQRFVLPNLKWDTGCKFWKEGS